MSDARRILSEVFENRYGYGCVQEVWLEDDRGQICYSRMARRASPREGILVRVASPYSRAGSGWLLLEDTPGHHVMHKYDRALGVRERPFRRDRGLNEMTEIWHEDVVGQRLADWSPSLAGEETLEGHDCWVLDVDAEPASPSSYRHMKLWVPKAMPIILRGELTPREPEPSELPEYRVLHADSTRVEEIDGHFVPTVQTLVGQLNPATKAFLRVRSIGNPPDDLFDPARLDQTDRP
jgi:hypothetical protein